MRAKEEWINLINELGLINSWTRYKLSLTKPKAIRWQIKGYIDYFIAHLKGLMPTDANGVYYYARFIDFYGSHYLKKKEQGDDLDGPQM